MRRILEVVARELREALPATMFFLVAFHMIAVTKAVTLEDYDLSARGSTVATVGALLVAKAILVVERLSIARLFSHRLAYTIVWKAVLFGVVALLFRFVEELVPLVAKHEGVVAAVTSMAHETSWPHFWVLQMWLFALLLLYCFAAELGRVIGVERLRAMLREPSAPPR